MRLQGRGNQFGLADFFRPRFLGETPHFGARLAFGRPRAGGRRLAATCRSRAASLSWPSASGEPAAQQAISGFIFLSGTADQIRVRCGAARATGIILHLDSEASIASAVTRRCISNGQCWIANSAS